MAKILHGAVDADVTAIADALGAYETTFQGAQASLYRQNPGTINIRIIDDRFSGMSRSRRHDEVWDFLSHRVPEDAMTEISSLILLPKKEIRSSLANVEFEDPLPSEI